MKICPNCQTRYTDDTLQFCLQDGTALLSDDAQTSMPTAVFNAEQETVVKNRLSGAADHQTAPKKSNTALVVVSTILAMLLIFGIGIGAWLYFGNK